MKEYFHLCSENLISWIFGAQILGYFLKMRISENQTTEIRMSQGPGVNGFTIIFKMKIHNWP